MGLQCMEEPMRALICQASAFVSGDFGQNSVAQTTQPKQMKTDYLNGKVMHHCRLIQFQYRRCQRPFLRCLVL
jgi:hypothetical protein